MIRSFGRAVPRVHPRAFVHDSAEVIGRVILEDRSSVWPLCVLRGDVDRIVLGARSNLQDLCAVHCRRGRPALIGRGTTVGHRVVLHGCRIGDGCLIGMGAVVMEAELGAGCLVGAGAVVLAGFKAPAGSLILGSPARVVRRLRSAERRLIRDGEGSYLRLAEAHRSGSRLLFP